MALLQSKSPKDELIRMWGQELQSEQDVWDVFHCYLSGTPNKEGVQITKIPWNDEKLSPETALVKDKLSDFNKRGVLTINSQVFSLLRFLTMNSKTFPVAQC